MRLVRLSAQAAVASARKAAADLEIKAPLDATIGAVLIQAGEWAQAGQPLLVLIDLDHLTVETSDLSERDIPRVVLGQAVQVSVDALGEELTGKVVLISPLAETLGGDVIYKTTIELETVPAGLLPGMSVDVRFDPIEK